MMNLKDELDLLEIETSIDSPFGSTTNKIQDVTDGPLAILRPATVLLLSTMLNPIKIIPTDSGLPRDWRGLAELAGLTAEKMSYLETKGDPMQELLKLSSNLLDSRFRTIKDLKAFLAIIDRYDVVDDGESLFESDITFYRSRVSQLNANSKYPTVLDLAGDFDLLTYDDTIASEKRTRYDAFILYAEEDSEFADEVVNKLETEYKLKLCVKERDLLPGVRFAHEAVGKLIEQRCNRLLVIFSPSFLQSEWNQFLVSFTQALALESRERKIIPCMYKRCELPMSVRYSFCLDYNRAGKLWNFWDKLSKSLSTTTGVVGNDSTDRAIGSSSTALIKTGTSLPAEAPSWWDPTKESDHNDATLRSFDNLSLASDNSLLSSSLPKYSSKSSSKKWYKKMIGSTKNKKRNEKVKVLATAN